MKTTEIEKLHLVTSWDIGRFIACGFFTGMSVCMMAISFARV